MALQAVLVLSFFVLSASVSSRRRSAAEESLDAGSSLGLVLLRGYDGLPVASDACGAAGVASLVSDALASTAYACKSAFGSSPSCSAGCQTLLDAPSPFGSRGDAVQCLKAIKEGASSGAGVSSDVVSLLQHTSTVSKGAFAWPLP